MHAAVRSCSRRSSTSGSRRSSRPRRGGRRSRWPRAPLSLLPFLLLWGVAFRAFELYRRNRLGSRVSEWLDVAKASTLGPRGLLAIMTFACRAYEYSRLVILLCLAQSIVPVAFARAAL